MLLLRGTNCYPTCLAAVMMTFWGTPPCKLLQFPRKRDFLKAQFEKKAMKKNIEFAVGTEYGHSYGH